MKSDLKLLEKFILNHTQEALAAVVTLEEGNLIDLFCSLPSQLSSCLLSKMGRFQGAGILERIDPAIGVQLVDELPVPAAAGFLSLVSENRSGLLISELPPEKGKTIQRILSYPKNTIGAHVNPEVFVLHQDLAVGDGLESIKSHHLPITGPIPVLSDDQSLVGYVSFKELISAEDTKRISSIMNTDPPKIQADTKVSVSLLEGWSWSEYFHPLPVVDARGLFLGVITKESLSKISAKEKAMDHRALQASSALGDLYQIGLSSLFGAARE